MDNWQTTILEWVNCLRIVEPIADLLLLKQSLFFEKIISKLLKNEFLNKSNIQESLHQFIKDAYPDFEIGEDGIDMDNVEELVYICSLIMHYCAINIEDPSLREPPCRLLSSKYQEQVMHFIQSILKHNGRVTRKIIENAITESCNNLPKSSNRPHSTESLMPKLHNVRQTTRLTELIHSPEVKRQKQLENLTRELRNLKAELETERDEKLDLQEEIKKRDITIQHLTKEVQKNKTRINQLKSQINEVTDDPPSKSLSDEQFERINKLRSSLKEAEKRIEDLQLENTEKENKNLALSHKLSTMENELILYQTKYQDYEMENQALTELTKKQSSEIKNLNSKINELKNIINDFQTPNDSANYSNDSFVMPESEHLGTVIELQLKDIQLENDKLKNIIEQLKEDGDTFQQLLNTQKLEIAKYKQELKEKTEVTDHYYGEMKCMQKSLDKLNAEYKILQTNYQHVEENLELKKIECETLQENLDKLNENYKITITKLEEEIISKNVSLEHKEKSFNNLKQETDDLKESIRQLIDKTEQLNRKLSQVENLNRDKDNTITEQNEKIEILQNNFQKLENEKQNLLIEKSGIENQLKILNDQNIELNNKLTNAIQELEEKTNYCLELERKLNQSEYNFEQNKKILMNIVEENQNVLWEQLVHVDERDSLLNLRVQHINDKLISASESYKRLINDYRRNNSEYELKIKELTLEKESLQQNYQKLFNEKETLLDQLKKLEDSKLNVEEQLSKVENEKCDLIKQHEKAISDKDAIIKEFELNSTDLKNEITKVTGKNIMFIKEVDILSNNLKTLENEKEIVMENYETLQNKHQKMLSEKDNEIDRLTHDYKLLNTKLLDIENEKIKIEADKKQLDEEIASMKNIHEDFLKKHTIELQDFINKNQSLLIEKSAIEKQLEILNDQNVELNNKLTNTMQELEEKTNDYLELERKLNQNECNFEQNKKILLNVVEENQNVLWEQLVYVDEWNSLLNLKVQHINDKLISASESYKRLINDYRKNNSELELKIKEFTLEKELLEQNYQKLLDEKEMLLDQLKKSEDSKLNVEEQLSKVENEKCDLIKQHEKAISNKDAIIKEFELILADLKNEIAKVTEKNIMFIKEVDILSSSLKTLENEKEIVMENYETLQNKHQKMLSEKDNEIDRLTHDYKQLNTKLLDIENEKIKIEANKKQLDEEIATIKNIHEDFLKKHTIELQDFINKNTELYKTIAKLEQQVDYEKNSRSEIQHLLRKQIDMTEKSQEQIHKATDEIKQLKIKIDQLNNENNLIKNENDTSKLENLNVRTDMNRLREAYEQVMKENSQLHSDLNNVKKLLTDRDLQLDDASRLKEAYEKVFKENTEIKQELEYVKEKRVKDKEEFKSQLENATKAHNARMKELRNDYDVKLEKMKIKMRQLYSEEVTKADKKKDMEIQTLCRQYNEKIQTYEECIKNLQSQIWTMGDRVLSEQQKGRQELPRYTSHESLQNFGRESIFFRDKTTTPLDALFHSASQESLNKISNRESYLPVGNDKTTTRQRLSSMPLLRNGREKRSNRVSPSDESTQKFVEPVMKQPVGRKSTMQRNPPSAIGQGLHMEDEEGEMFHTNYLSDLKSVEEDVQMTNKVAVKERLNEIKQRNSICPPHLKSSYPAETQFISPSKFKEDDIKSGNIHLDDSLNSCLLPGEKIQRRDRIKGSTSYKKPGPPTPSKNAGRASLQGTEFRDVLREHNFDGSNVNRKSSTPSRFLKALFPGRNSSSLRTDIENQPDTPRGRRLNIFRRQRN